MYKTGELREVMESFEKALPNMLVGSYRLDRESKEMWQTQRAFYQDGTTNTLFVAYLHGHSHGRCYERSV